MISIILLHILLYTHLLHIHIHIHIHIPPIPLIITLIPILPTPLTPPIVAKPKHNTKIPTKT